MAAAAAAESQLAEPFPHPLATKCRDVRTDFAKIGRIGEGTYGKVYKARDKMTGEVVALKRIFLLNEKSEGFPLAGLREITSLRALRHPNIVDLRDVALGPKGDVFLVCEFCDNDLMVMAEHRDEPFTEAQVKCILVQLLRAVQHVHDRGYVHRDIKMSNLLYRNGRVKLGDFGLARPCPPGSGRYSSRVVTLWFRAPELLLGSTTYGSALDMWSVGCVAAELLLGRPLFPAAVEHDAVVLISRLLGPPSPDRFPEVERLPSPPQAAITEGAAAIRRALVSACLHGRPLPVPPHPRSPAAAHASPPDAFEAVFPRLCPEGLDFLRRLLAYSPARRLSAAEALAHPYLTTVAPPPADPAHMPFCRDQISIDAEEAARGRRRRVVKPGPAADPTDLDPGRKPAALIATSAVGMSIPPTVAPAVARCMEAWASFPGGAGPFQAPVATAEMPSLEWMEANAPNVYEPAEDTYLLLDAIQGMASDLGAARPALVVEVGPGAGAVTSFLAMSLGDDAACLAIDINPEAVSTTLRTAKDNGVDGRVACVGGDLLAPLSAAAATAASLQGEPGATSRVGAELSRRGAHGASEGVGAGTGPCWAAADVIVFNPPYVPTPDEEVEDSDIARAWAGGERGRRVIDRFLPMLPQALARPGGAALMVVVQENDPADIAAAAAALGLVTLGAVSKKARNERLSVLKFRWPLPEGEEAPSSEAGMTLLGSPSG